MLNRLTILKGIHPGAFLERELKNRKLSQRKFALSIGEHPQTICAITKGKRDMNIPLSLKIEHGLAIKEGLLMTLQVYHTIKKIKEEQDSKHHPDLTLFRNVIFWDTDPQKINWEQQKIAVVKRVFERGNDIEKSELIRFYGKESIEEIFK